MPSFVCQTCGSSFELPAQTLEKFPGWNPKFCREHSPQRGASGGKSGGASVRSKSGRAASKGGRRARPGGASSREENLTVAQVLETYTKGPDTGVFTDGSSIPNPGPGGWGVVWVEAGEVRAQGHGHEARTTNNRMELQALIEAFRLLPEDAAVTVYTDSRLCVDTITKWAPNWERKGWTKKGGEIKNLELVQELLALYRSRPNCKLEWIAAHSGNRWNEYADSLSTAWKRDEL